MAALKICSFGSKHQGDLTKTRQKCENRAVFAFWTPFGEDLRGVLGRKQQIFVNATLTLHDSHYMTHCTLLEGPSRRVA